MCNGKEIFLFFVLGFFIGWISLGLLYRYASLTDPEHKQIEECEKELPRNKQCKLIAIPK